MNILLKGRPLKDVTHILTLPLDTVFVINLITKLIFIYCRHKIFEHVQPCVPSFMDEPLIKSQ